MGLFSSILGVFGVGENPTYGFTQQQKDFIKLQFKYALTLKQKLATGEITQDYYNNNLWLTTETLDAPYAGWWDEFKTAIDSEDLDWLAKQTGETVDSLTKYMGNALTAVGQKVGSVIGTVVSSSTTGLVSGFFTSLNFFGWVVVAGTGVAIYYGFKTGTIQKAFKTGAKAAIL